MSLHQSKQEENQNNEASTIQIQVPSYREGKLDDEVLIEEPN